VKVKGPSMTPGPCFTMPLHLSETSVSICNRNRIFRPARGAGRLASFLKDEVDLRHLEPGQFDIDVELDQPLQFNRQQLPIPPGRLGEPIVGQDIGALIGVAHGWQRASMFVVALSGSR
jgi:hypothetical protein